MSDPDTALTVFSAPQFDIIEDLCGDPLTAGLNVLVAGNQFMVMPDLVAGFVAATPEVGSVFYETLPPGVVVDQVRACGLRIGTLELRVRPDVIAASPDALRSLELDGLCKNPHSYATNDLSILVGAGNPMRVRSLSDLGRPDLRVAVPDPDTEGIGRLALMAFEDAGGPELRAVIEGTKRADRTAVFTTIHHRQSPAWLAAGTIDAAIVWSTEARHHLRSGAPFEEVNVDATHNKTGTY
ncbi:MAG: molybdate ABC transporter substrate-binding protein, partial [Acidimicrobiales bacterium]